MYQTDNQDFTEERMNIVVDENGNEVDFAPEKEPFLPFLPRRLFEVIALSIVAGLPFFILNLIFGMYEWEGKFYLISLVIFVIANIYFNRAFYYGMGNKKVYFSVTLTAYTIYAILNIICIFNLNYDSNTSIFTFLFMPTKFLYPIISRARNIVESQALTYKVTGAILTHIMMYIFIALSPFEMYLFELTRRRK